MSFASALLLVLTAFGTAFASEAASPEGSVGLRGEEARASAVLAERVQSVLDRRFGPGRAAVSASVRLKLSDRGSAWIARLLAPPDSGASPKFSWGWEKGNPRAARQFLPGIPTDDADSPEKPGAGPPPVGVAAELLGRFETEVEDLRVRVLLDEALGPEAEAAALSLAEEAADASTARGDRVSVVRAPLPAPSERMLRDPAVLARLAGPAAAAGLGLAALGGAIFLALALASSLRRGAETVSAAMVRAAERGAAGALEVRRNDARTGESGEGVARQQEEAPRTAELAAECRRLIERVEGVVESRGEAALALETFKAALAALRATHPTEPSGEAALPTDSGSGIPSPMARSEVPPTDAIGRRPPGEVGDPDEEDAP